MASRTPLGQILLADGVITADVLDHALAEQDRQRRASLSVGSGRPKRLGSILFEHGVSEAALVQTLSDQLGHPGLVLSVCTVDLAALALVPRVVAERLRVLPVDVDEHTITLAVGDPSDDDLLSQVAFATGRQVQPLIALEGLIATLCESAYSAKEQGARHLDGAGGGTPGDDTGLIRLEILRPELPLVQGLPADEEIEISEPTDEWDGDFSTDEWDLDGVRTVGVAHSVLVVDDDKAIRELLTKVLEKDGYTVEQAATGREALDMLQAVPPRLVLLDAMLPEVHGFQICQHIKQSPQLSRIPVIMISAVYRGWEQARSVQETYGADRFIEKPFDVHYLRKMVAELLGENVDVPTADPTEAALVNNLRQQAQGAYEQQDDERALHMAQQWADAAPFDAVPHLLCGNILHKHQRHGEALAAFERAATFGPQLFAAQKNLALAYEKLGFVRRAFERWRWARQVVQEPELRAKIDKRLQTRYAQFL